MKVKELWATEAEWTRETLKTGWDRGVKMESSEHKPGKRTDIFFSVDVVNVNDAWNTTISAHQL